VRNGLPLTANLGTVEAVQPTMPGVWLAELTLHPDLEPGPWQLVLSAAGVPSNPVPVQ
jgi:hypothetical protein